MQHMQQLCACLQAISCLRRAVLPEPGKAATRSAAWIRLTETKGATQSASVVCGAIYAALQSAGVLLRACHAIAARLPEADRAEGSALVLTHSYPTAKALVAAAQLKAWLLLNGMCEFAEAVVEQTWGLERFCSVWMLSNDG